MQNTEIYVKNNYQMVKNRNECENYKFINATLRCSLINAVRLVRLLKKGANVMTKANDHRSLRCADQANRFFE